MIWAFKYLQKFNIEIYHKPGKQYIISEVLFKLASINSDVKSVFMKDKLDVLFIVLLVQIKPLLK